MIIGRKIHEYPYQLFFFKFTDAMMLIFVTGRIIFQTLYLLKTKVEPNTGGELCRASTICSLSITIEQIKELPPAHIDNTLSVMYEVS